ncbi:MAG: hypothetical protein KHZ62_04710 [Clostridiales bacterium]|nr:hypothetical protein [Clostridiales bacterium]
MESVLVKSCGFIFLIILGYVLKRVGLFHQEDSKVLVKIMLYVTLPALLINAFRDFTLDISLIGLIFVGFFVNVFMTLVGWLVGPKDDARSRAMYMICMAGFNIGSFSMPFVQNFFPERVLNVVMFDIGNTIMCCGVTFSFAAMLLKPDEKFSFKALGKNLVGAFPFDLYISLFILSLLNIKFPEPVYSIATTIAGGNIVIVMLMLGILFEVRLTKKAKRQIFEIVLFRMVFETILAFVAYFLLPFSLEQRQIIVLLIYSPITSMSTIFCGKLDCDADVYGTATSITIPISIAVMVGLVLLWTV